MLEVAKEAFLLPPPGCSSVSVDFSAKLSVDAALSE